VELTSLLADSRDAPEGDELIRAWKRHGRGVNEEKLIDGNVFSGRFLLGCVRVRAMSMQQQGSER